MTTTSLFTWDERKRASNLRKRTASTSRLHVLVFMRREGRTRVISLRKSNAREIATYAASKKSS